MPFDLDPALSDAEQLAIIVAELQLVGGRQEVGYPAGRRTVFRTQVDEVTAEDLLPPLENAVVLATEGARGITAEVLREIARPGNAGADRAQPAGRRRCRYRWFGG